MIELFGMQISSDAKHYQKLVLKKLKINGKSQWSK